MHDDNVRISPPLYIAHTVISCWRCGEDMPAVALIAPHVITPQFQEAEGEVCILLYIEALPETVLRFLRKRFPSFKFTHSRTTDSQYYANTCPKCGVISGDFYLYCEPDGPFFPMTEEVTKEITVEAIPLEECDSVRAGGFGMAGDLILKHAKRLEAESAAGHEL